MSGAAPSGVLPPDRQPGASLPKRLSSAVGALVAIAVSTQRIRKDATVTEDVCAPLIIEFVGGIPAAGKTTIARACRALGAALGYPVYLNVKGLSRSQTVRAFLGAPLLWRCLYYALKLPLLAREKNESFLGHRWRSLLEARLYFAMLYEFTRRHANSVVFLDQWMSRKLDVVGDERHAADVFRFVAESDRYFDRYYVFLDLPIEAAIDRGWQRTWQRKSGAGDRWYREQHLDRATLHQYYLDKHARYEQRYARFAKHGLKVLRLDAQQPPEDNARLIMDRLVQPYVTSERASAFSHQVPRYESPGIQEARSAAES
jgi:thymidylate kinase